MQMSVPSADPQAARTWLHPLSWPYSRVAIILAVVTIGGSQILFNMILGNREYFPRSAAFHFWVLIWIQLLPAAVLFALDGLFLRLAGEESRGMRLWRAFLYAGTSLLLLRQAQVSHPGIFYALFPSALAVPAYPVVAVVVLALSLWKPRGVDRYFSVLGILALLLTAQYVKGTRSPPEDVTGGAMGVSDPPTPGRPIVLLVFDEWSLDTLVKDGRIDREAFPRVAAVAEEGAWFPTAVSNAPTTEASTLILLTGRRYPNDREPMLFERLRDTHRVTVQMAWPSFQRWLAKLAAKPGDRYLTRTDSEALHLGPLDVLSFLQAALAESAFIFEGWSAPSGERLPPPDLWDLWTSRDILAAETASFLSLLTREQCRGGFLYWHCSQPHFPFSYDSKGVRHGRSHDAFWGKGGRDEREIWANYLESARGVDRLVGLVVDRLKAEGLYEETTLIITSDHGVRTYGAMELKGYPDVQSGRVVRIPFILRGPSIRPGVYDAEYQNMDFAPTLLDVLGVPFKPGEFDGISAFRSERPLRESTFGGGKDEFQLDRASGEWKRKR